MFFRAKRDQEAQQSSSQQSSNQVTKGINSGTVASRIQSFNARVAQAQADAAQEKLWQSRSSTPRDDRSRVGTPSTEVRQSFTFPAPTYQTLTSPKVVPATPDLAWQSDKVLAKETEQPPRTTTPVPGSWPSEDKALTAIKLLPGPSSPTLQFRHRETQQFQAPPGIGTDYAHEHRGKHHKHQAEDSTSYNPNKSQSDPAASPIRRSAAITQRSSGSVLQTEPASPTPKRHVRGFSADDANTPWAKFGRLDKDEKRPEKKDQGLQRPMSEGGGSPVVAVSILSQPGGHEQAKEVTTNIPAFESVSPQLILTLTIANQHQMCIHILPAVEAVSPVVGNTTGQSPRPEEPGTGTAADPAATAVLVSLKDGTDVKVTSAEQSTQTQSCVLPGMITAPPTTVIAEPEKVLTIPIGTVPVVPQLTSPPSTIPITTLAEPEKGLTTPIATVPVLPQTNGPPLMVPTPTSPIVPQPNSVPSITQPTEPTTIVTQQPVPPPTKIISAPPSSPSLQETLDVVILEHRVALTSITNRLSTELNRLAADYTSALPTPTSTPPQAFPEPHRAIATEVIPFLSKQVIRMQDLVDEVVRHAKEVWCVDLNLVCLYFEGHSAKALQMEQIARARRMMTMMWSVEGNGGGYVCWDDGGLLDEYLGGGWG